MKTRVKLRHKKEIINYVGSLLLTWGFESKENSKNDFSINNIDIQFDIYSLTLTLVNIFNFIANNYNKKTLTDTLALIDFLNNKIVDYALENDFLRID